MLDLARGTYLPLLDAREPAEDLDELLGDLAYYYRKLGLETQAIALYERARELDPLDSEW